jgi:hypothetical protein
LPVYSMRNTETHEDFEVSMKYSDLAEYLQSNPKLKQAFTKFPGVCDSARIGGIKTPDSFKDVLRNVKSHHLHSTIET